jgi:DNA invertase Pin-like site-specific DNA recombinase
LEDIDLDGLDKYESNSIGNQRAYLDDFIAKIPEFAECEIIEALDDGRTGTNFLRPGVQRLIEMARSGRVDCIVVKDLSRWGRSYLDVGDFLEQKFPEWGVRFISINDNYDSAALNGTTGGIDIAFKNLIYDLYSQDLSVKVRSGKNTAAKSGKICASYPLFGYDKDPADQRQLIIDPLDSLVVKRIFDIAEQGSGVAEIVRILNAENVPTMQESKHRKGYKTNWGAGKYWGTWVVSRIVKDERYTGKWIWGASRVTELGSHNGKPVPRDEWIIVPGAIPAIITEEQFERVQKKLALKSKPKTGKHKTNRPLFKRMVKCADCGRTMTFSPRKEGMGMFLCKLHDMTGERNCSTGHIEESDLCNSVLALIQQQAALAGQVKRKAKSSIKTVAGVRAEIQSVKSLAEKSKTAKMALWEKYHAGDIPKEKFQSESEKISAQVSAYNDRIAELETEAKRLELSADEENAFVERYARQIGITELTQKLVDEFVKEIKVYAPDRIEIVLNYADEYAKLGACTADGVAGLADAAETKRRVTK